MKPKRFLDEVWHWRVLMDEGKVRCLTTREGRGWQYVRMSDLVVFEFDGKRYGPVQAIGTEAIPSQGSRALIIEQI